MRVSQDFLLEISSNLEVIAKTGGKSCIYFRKMTKILMGFVAFTSEQILTVD
jgi:hypothetical protein